MLSWVETLQTTVSSPPRSVSETGATRSLRYFFLSWLLLIAPNLGFRHCERRGKRAGVRNVCLFHAISSMLHPEKVQDTLKETRPPFMYLNDKLLFLFLSSCPHGAADLCQLVTTALPSRQAATF